MTNNGYVLSYGEMLLRLSFFPLKSGDKKVSSFYGGSEGNVLMSLSSWDEKCKYCSFLPDSFLGATAKEYLVSSGIEPDFIYQIAGRMALYFVDEGIKERSKAVTYDRKNTPTSLTPINLSTIDKMVSGAKWFHFSGIDLAISETARSNAISIAKASKEKGLPVSFDINFRPQLWSIGEARGKIEEALQLATYVFASFYDLEVILGLGESKEKALSNFFLSYPKVTIFIHEANVDDKKLYGYAYRIKNGKNEKRSSSIEFDSLSGRFGGGDAFASGVIYGLLNGKSNQDSLFYGLAALKLKKEIGSDVLLCSKALLEKTTEECDKSSTEE